jgi:ABC-type sugar transport system ATPase subunit
MEISQNKPVEIEISSASVFYGKERVLENLNLSIKEQRVGFIGRNGSGKTTLLRILAGLQELHNGKVLVDGTEVAKKKKRSH